MVCTMFTSKTDDAIKYEPSTIMPRQPLSYYGKMGKILGTGEFGKVFLYTGPNREFAIKSLNGQSEPMGGGGLIRASTIREISALIRLKHPNVVSLIDIIPTKSEIHLVMAKAEFDLFYYLNNGGFNLKAFKSAKSENDKSIAYQMISGVNYYLSRGIINRDLKPMNILIYADGTVKVADFGLSRPMISSFDSGATEDQYTLWYRPPEVLFGGKYTESADIWALGCTLYEIYTAKPLFREWSQGSMIYRIFMEFGRLECLWPSIVDLPHWDNFKYISTNHTTNNIGLIEIPEIKSMIRGMLSINPELRTPLHTILKDSYFDSVRHPAEDLVSYSYIQILQQRSHRPISNIKNPSLIDRQSVKIVLSWLQEVSEDLKLEKQTFFLAQILLNRYITKREVTRNKFQLVGSCCLILATLMMEVVCPSLYTILGYCAGLYTDQETREMIMDINTTLGFDFIHTTSVDFLNVFISMGQYPEPVLNQSYLLLQILTIDDSFYEYTPQEMAAGCLFLACNYVGFAFDTAGLFLDPNFSLIKFGKRFLSYVPSQKTNRNIGKIKVTEDNFISGVKEVISKHLA